MDDVTVSSKELRFCRCFLHAEDAEIQVDDDCNELVDVDVDVVIERRVQNRKAWRDRVDLVDRFGKSLLAPLKVQEETVAAKAKHAGV